MYQIVHGASGILIGSQVASPWLAFIFGFVSHFILDLIPHDAIEFKKWRDKGDFVKKFLLEATFDLWLFVILILILQSNNLITFSLPILAGIIGALAPDYIWGFGLLFKIKGPFRQFYIFHEKVHTLFYQQIYLPAIYALPLQLVFLSAILYCYIFFR